MKLRVKLGVCSKVNVNPSLNLKSLKRFSAKIKRKKEFHTA